MASTSECKESKQVKQEERNWLDLPSEITANILNRVGVFDRLENVQKVCTPWRKICKDPAMWKVIYMDNKFSDRRKNRFPLREMCKQAIDRSQGQLEEISIVDFANDRLLRYIASSASQLKRLEITCCYGKINNSLAKSLEKFPLLEELSLCKTTISREAIETAGRVCPNLKTLKVNQQADLDWDDEELFYQNKTALAIGASLRGLRHLELIGSGMSFNALQYILDGFNHLESLDLRQCFFIELDDGDLGKIIKICSEQIKCLKLPNDSVDDCPYIEWAVKREFYDSDEEYRFYWGLDCLGVAVSDTDSDHLYDKERAMVEEYYSL